MQKSGIPSRRVLTGGGIAAVVAAVAIGGAVWLGSNTAKTEITPVGSVAQVLPNTTPNNSVASAVTIGDTAPVVVGTVISGNSTPADANLPLSTSRVQLNISLNLSKVKVPVYATMSRKYIAPTALDSLIDRLISAESQKLLGFFNNKINFETYKQPTDCGKLKTSYATDLGNAGWKNVSDLFTSSLSGSGSGTSLESAGGFSSSYQKNEGFTAYITTITCMPAATATASGVTGLAATDFLVTFTIITQP